MPPEYKALLRSAFEKYLECLAGSELEPNENFLDYEYTFLKGRKWHLLAEMMIECELRELTNILNHWNSSLYRWHAWNRVLVSYDEDTAWTLRSEFLDAIAHECLLRPSAIRDTFISVATNSIHQIRLSTEKKYRDVLDGDQLTPEEKPKYLTRRQRESRLAKVGNIFPLAHSFLVSLRDLDCLEYRNATSDYRNLNSHTIGPRLGIGHTRTVTRIVAQETKLVDIGGGRFEDTLIPGKMQVSYDFGGTEPLDLESARAENLRQFRCARLSYLKYREFLQNAVSAVPAANTDA